MLFTWFLGEPVIKALKTWNTLGERFLKENRIGILHDCGFDTGRLPMERIRVKSPDLFLAYIAAMARCGMLDCSLEELADYIDLIFDTGYEVVTIYNHLKAAQNTFWEIDQAVEKSKKKERKQQCSK